MRVRITVVATVVFALAFTGVAFLLVLRVQGTLEDALERENDAAILAIRTSIDAGVPPPDALVAARRYNVPVQAYDENGRAIGGNIVGVGRAEPAGAAAPTVDQQMHATTPDGRNVLVTRSAVETDRGMLTLEAQSPLASVQTSVSTITGILVVGTPMLVAGFAAMVWILVGRSLRPVDVLRAEVDEISHTTMHRRVREPGTNDEVDRLAITMNEMLDRLEGASDRQRRFVSDASHELKTPLATIRTTLEVAMRNPDGADWPAVAQQVLDADRSMTDLVADLLDLARLDEPVPSATIGAESAVVDLDDVVMAVVAEQRADPSGPTIDASAVVAGRVRGDPGDLERLVRNLVVNAEQHGRQQVAVRLDSAGDVVTLVVGDDGPGIAPEDRMRVFDRFAMVDPSRTKATGGTGLGLAIVKAIVERHGGAVAAGASPLGGAELVVTLPAAS